MCVCVYIYMTVNETFSTCLSRGPKFLDVYLGMKCRHHLSHNSHCHQAGSTQDSCLNIPTHTWIQIKINKIVQLLTPNFTNTSSGEPMLRRLKS